MSRGFLLDTNVVSELIRGSPDAGVIGAMEKHRGEMAIGAPVWHELCFGCDRLPRSRRRRLLERWLTDVVAASLPVLPYDAGAAAWHAAERARLSRRGRLAPFVDGQIAAIAATNDLILVTANRKDFARFRGLAVEDWLTRS
ncbi:MAG: PIN domain-containing protein [Planctomycetota bacterium]